MDMLQIITGNRDARSTVLRRLDAIIVVRKLRLIPVSELKRTVCLRLELYGCAYRGACFGWINCK
jgi:discoidin domain receptor family protein 2